MALTIEDYMDLGPLEASEVVREITGSPTVNVMGYCIGGTLLAMTLAWLAAKGDTPVQLGDLHGLAAGLLARSATRRCSSDEPAIDFIEQQMMERGYLDSREMSNMFNLLRSNDLIWSNVVNNYLLGKSRRPSTCCTGTATARGWPAPRTAGTCATPIVENNLIKPGKIALKGEALDLGRITLDTYAVGAEKDHIVPWDAAWRITQLVGGKVRFVLASSGHIAGIINPPGGKGTYWVDASTGAAARPQEWRKAAATRHDGSWWTDWTRWLAEHSGCEGRAAGDGQRRAPAAGGRAGKLRAGEVIPDHHEKRPAVTARAEPAEVGGMESIPHEDRTTAT